MEDRDGLPGLMSPVQRHLLALFFGQPDRVYRNGELMTIVGSGVGAVHRQLRQFEAAGLIRSMQLGNQRYFTSDTGRTDHALLVELVRNGIGLVGPVAGALAPLAAGIREAWIHGAAAAGKDEPGSPVEVVVVTDLVPRDRIDALLDPVRRWLARPIDLTLVTGPDWLGLGEEPDLFIAAIAQGARLPVIRPSVAGGSRIVSGGTADLHSPPAEPL